MEESADKSIEVQKTEDNDGLPINTVAQRFLMNIDKQRECLGSEFSLCTLLIGEAFDRVYATSRMPGTKFLADANTQKSINVIKKVYVPVKQFPKVLNGVCQCCKTVLRVPVSLLQFYEFLCHIASFDDKLRFWICLYWKTTCHSNIIIQSLPTRLLIYRTLRKHIF